MVRRSERARWLQARTRNAARHTLLIAGAGTLVLVTALLTFVLVPRQVDRTLATALRALPAPRDTVALLAARDTADRTRAALVAQADSAAAARDSVAELALSPDSASLMSPRSIADDLLELEQQIERAKQAPLVESYRALSETRALRAVRRSRATLDSIELLHGEREAWAALGGPDARYAALTEQLTRLGARLVQIAEQAADARRAVIEPRVDTISAFGADTTLGATPNADSLLAANLRSADEALARIDSTLEAARVFNAETQRARDALRTRLQVAIPPQAMLLASLVLAVAGGFGAALWREVRRPTVGDAEELEALTRARVIVHRAEGLRRTGGLRTRLAGATGRGTPDDAWSLLHVSLSRIGEVSRRLQVVADQPALAATVAARLATTAAAASRATVLVDATSTGLSAASLPPVTPPVTTGERHGSPWEPARPVVVARDLSLDVVRLRRSGRRPRPTGLTMFVEAQASLATLLQPYDLAVLVADALTAPGLPADSELVLCAREGVTPLTWLSRVVRAADAEGRPVRAVLLWSGELPLAG